MLKSYLGAKKFGSEPKNYQIYTLQIYQMLKRTND